MAGVDGGRTDLSGVAISRGPETSRSEKWRYWRCGLRDGTRVTVGVQQKAPGKAGIGIGYEKLESDARIEHWRAFWKGLLEAL